MANDLTIGQARRVELALLSQTIGLQAQPPPAVAFTPTYHIIGF